VIEVLFTRSDLPGSRWIREITGESVSHCAILYYNKVIHSSYWGVERLNYTDFIKHNVIVYRVELPIKPEAMIEIYEKF